MAVQSFGSGLRAHVHFHILVTDGVYFPDGSYFALGFWDQPSLLSELRNSILKSLVARNCLQPETAKLLESWPLDSRPSWESPSTSRPTVCGNGPSCWATRKATHSAGKTSTTSVVPRP